MEYLRVLVMAVVQGIAEFLPISSSGHLVVASALFEACGLAPLEDVTDVNIVLHAGTLLTIVVVYRKTLWRMLHAERHIAAKLAVATLPIVPVGLAFHEMPSLTALLEDPTLAGCMLIVTGVMLLVVARLHRGEADFADVTYRQALLIGAFQATAILPGLSRSGLTIAAGILVGLRRESAAKFSLLMAVPAIAGATLLAAIELAKNPAGGTTLGAMLSGAAVAFVVGLAAVWWLLRWVATGRLGHFAYWCVPVGAAVIVWQLA